MKKDTPFNCKHLDEEKDDLRGFLISERIVREKDGYAIEGCCGGGCYVIVGIKYCPFCGERLK